MRSSVPLFEFMPYGAPELIESRQRHLSRALALASATALVLYAMSRGLAPLLHVTPAEPHLTVVEPGAYVIPPPLFRIAPPAPGVPVARAAPGAGVPVPVPVVDAPPSDAVAPAPSDVIGLGTPGLAGPSALATPAPGQDVLPAPDVYVYVEHLPAPVTEVKPVYPRIAEEAGVEGLVLVRVLVGKDGRVHDVRLAETQQVPLLNQAALEAARRWVFTPGLANGQPVACWTAIPFRFRLH